MTNPFHDQYLKRIWAKSERVDPTAVFTQMRFTILPDLPKGKVALIKSFRSFPHFWKDDFEGQILFPNINLSSLFDGSSWPKFSKLLGSVIQNFSIHFRGHSPFSLGQDFQLQLTTHGDDSKLMIIEGVSGGRILFSLNFIRKDVSEQHLCVVRFHILEGGSPFSPPQKPVELFFRGLLSILTDDQVLRRVSKDTVFLHRLLLPCQRKEESVIHHVIMNESKIVRLQDFENAG